MAELTDIEYEMALERGKAAQDTGPAPPLHATIRRPIA